MSALTTLRPTIEQLLFQGIELVRRGRFAESLPILQKALDKAPHPTERWPGLRVALASHALALHQSGEPAQALRQQSRLLALNRGDDEARANFLVLLRAAGRHLPDDPQFRMQLLQLPETDDPSELSGFLGLALLADRQFKSTAERIIESDRKKLDEMLLRRKLNPVLLSPLLQRALALAPIPLPFFANLLDKLRTAFLCLLTKPPAGFRFGCKEYEFLGALALHYWTTEYASAVAPEEEAALATLPPANPDNAEQAGAILVAHALYAPPNTLPNWPDTARLMPEGFAPLLAACHEHDDEVARRSNISALTLIGEGVSEAVRAQYEANPFPRWRQRLAVAPRRAAAWLAGQSPALHPPTGWEGPIDLLVAGCGTGLEAISLAAQIDTQRLLAIDLSRASLAYATKMAEKHGLGERIEFRQADLLHLAEPAAGFDMITASGVLHHLADPLAGWQVLTRLLRPGGIMAVSLYSETARSAIISARQLIARRGLAASPANMRRLRAEILRGEHPELMPLTGWRDFYNLSMFRDLAFHAQEHCFSLPRIGAALTALKLDFAGMQGCSETVRQAFRQQFPDDPQGLDLEHWHAFEMRHPQTFAGMYRLLLQKPASA